MIKYCDNMGNLNNKEDFAAAYNDMLSKHDYRGLVGLLSSTTFSNDEANKTAKNLIAQFTEQADIEDKILEGADDKYKKSYNFVISGPSNLDLGDTKSPSYRFMTAWNALSDGDSPIEITFSTENSYNKFINNLGGNVNKIQQLGIKLGSNYSISFPKDVDNKIDIYNAVRESGLIADLNLAINMSAYDEPGIQHSRGSSYVLSEKQRILLKNFSIMDSVVKEANDDYKKLLSNTKPYISEMVVSGYMGEDDKQLQQSFSAGLLDLDTFKEMRSILEEKYNRILQTKSLSQFDVWAMNEDNKGSQLLQKLDDNILKSQLDEEINQAIADKRLHFAHASNGIDIGTMIVIDPKVDKDGKPINSDNNKPRRFFVKDLFKSQAENALRDDTKTHAQIEYAKHQTYKHIYRGANGFTITDWDQDSDTAIYTDKYGVSKNINKSQILDIIDDDIIVKRMIDFYDEATNLDENGKGYTQEYYKVFGNKDFNSKNLYDNLVSKCTAVVSEKYKGQSNEFIKYKTEEFISAIIKAFNEEVEDEKIDKKFGSKIDDLLEKQKI